MNNQNASSFFQPPEGKPIESAIIRLCIKDDVALLRKKVEKYEINLIDVEDRKKFTCKNINK